MDGFLGSSHKEGYFAVAILCICIAFEVFRDIVHDVFKNSALASPSAVFQLPSHVLKFTEPSIDHNLVEAFLQRPIFAATVAMKFVCALEVCKRYV